MEVEKTPAGRKTIMKTRYIVRRREHWITSVIIWAMLVSLLALGVSGWALEKEFDKQTQEKMEKALDKVMEESRSPAAIVGVWAPGEGT